MSNASRRQDLGLGKTAAGGSGGSFASHSREPGAAPPVTSQTAKDLFEDRMQEIEEGQRKLRVELSDLLHESLASEVLEEIPDASEIHLGRSWGGESDEWEFSGVQRDGEYIPVSIELRSKLGVMIDRTQRTGEFELDVYDSDVELGEHGEHNELAIVQLDEHDITARQLMRLQDQGKLQEFTQTLSNDFDRTVSKNMDTLDRYPELKVQVIDQKDFLLRVLEDDAVSSPQFRSGEDDRIPTYLSAARRVAAARSSSEFLSAFSHRA